MNKDELIKYIEEYLIPNYISIRKRKNDNGIEYYPSIRLGYINDLNLSYEDNLFVIDYLNDKNIHVSSRTSSDYDEFDNVDIYIKDKFSNKRFYYNYKDINKYILKYQENNDKELLDKIIRGNMRLVYYIYWKNGFNMYNIDENELIQSGLIGLFNAVNRYDSSYDNSFSTYAYKCINKSMLSSLYLSLGLRRYDSPVFKAMKEIDKDDNTVEYVDKIIDYIDKNDMLNGAYSLNTLRNRLLMETFVDNYEDIDEEDNVFYILGDNNTYDEDYIVDNINDKELRDKLENIIDELPNIEKIIMRGYYGFDGEPKSFREISKDLDISHQAIHKKKEKVIKKIRNNYDSELKKYM